MAGSSTNHTFSVITGTPVLSTARKKFGTSSLRIDGAERIEEDSEFQLPSSGSSGRTIEFWLNFNAQPAGGWNNPGEGFLGMAGHTATSWHLGLYTILGNFRVAFDWHGFGNGNSPQTVTTSSANNTWVHWAWVKNSSSDHKIYRNGTALSNISNTNFTGGFPQPSGGLWIGDRGISGMPALDYYMDELRISETARYTSNFTVESSPFSTDSDTSLLMHFDGANNDTDFIDEHIAPEAPPGFPNVIIIE